LARRLVKIEEPLIADEKEVGVEVMIVHHITFRMGGSAANFEAVFHFDDIISS
jgi:hypothetical protein